MITLDGVMQAPGGPEEDRSGGFLFGGWVASYGDAMYAQVIEKLMEPADILLGRKTFDIWEPYWPAHEKSWPGINDVTKYVLSNTRERSDWKNTVFLRSPEDIKKLRTSEGPDIQVWGSAALVQLLLAQDLADALRILIHPLVLGKGKKLFGNDAVPAAFALEESIITTTGVIIAHYRKAGKVMTGTVGA